MKPATEGDWAALRLERWRTRRDPDALGELLKWQRDRAYALAFAIVGREAEAEDAVQKACLKLLSRKVGFEDEARFKAAVQRAVIQCALNVLRALRVRQHREEPMKRATFESAQTPERSAERAEALELLREEFARLEDEERALLALCVQESIPLSQAALVLETPRETLRHRLARTLERLRDRLKRRGLPLSLVLVAGLLQQGANRPASAHLCQGLDAVLGGAPCGSVSTAAAVPTAPALLVAGAGLGLAGAPAFAAALAAGLAAVVGAWAVFAASPDSSAQTLPASAPSISAELAPESTPGRSAPPPLHEPAPAKPLPARIDAQYGSSVDLELESHAHKEEPDMLESRTQGAMAAPVMAAMLYSLSMAHGGYAADGKVKEVHGPQDLPVAEVPDEILRAAQAMVPDVTLTKATRHVTPPGVTYRLEGQAGGEDHEFSFTARRKGDGPKEPKDAQSGNWHGPPPKGDKEQGPDRPKGPPDGKEKEHGAKPDQAGGSMDRPDHPKGPKDKPEKESQDKQDREKGPQDKPEKAHHSDDGHPKSPPEKTEKGPKDKQPKTQGEGE
ncbi:MAG: sigma-70 family RNA polymerase sigma factor [Planctomycetota bacterium]|nr:sigma-70 family RNA polymerase sigma factor [Planctomycetota bacterium]